MPESELNRDEIEFAAGASTVRAVSTAAMFWSEWSPDKKAWSRKGMPLSFDDVEQSVMEGLGRTARIAVALAGVDEDAARAAGKAADVEFCGALAGSPWVSEDEGVPRPSPRGAALAGEAFGAAGCGENTARALATAFREAEDDVSRMRRLMSASRASF